MASPVLHTSARDETKKEREEAEEGRNGLDKLRGEKNGKETRERNEGIVMVSGLKRSEETEWRREDRRLQGAGGQGRPTQTEGQVTGS